MLGELRSCARAARALNCRVVSLTCFSFITNLDKPQLEVGDNHIEGGDGGGVSSETGTNKINTLEDL